MRSYLRLRCCALLSIALCSLMGLAAVLTDPAITPAPILFPRALPYEEDPALLGYRYGSDYTFTPSLCWTLGETLRTIGNQVHCCPTSTSECYITTDCSAGTAYVTITPSGKPFFEECSLDLYAMAGSCETSLIYERFESNMPTDQTALYTNMQCNYGAFLGGGRRFTLYRSIPADAAVNATASRQDTSPFPVAPTPSRTYAKSTSGAFSSQESTSPQTESPADPVYTRPTPRVSAPATSNTGSRIGISSFQPGANSQPTPTATRSPESGLSRSDNIALGVGIGIGLPTVILTALAWWYPRHRNHRLNFEFGGRNGLGNSVAVH